MDKCRIESVCGCCLLDSLLAVSLGCSNLEGPKGQPFTGCQRQTSNAFELESTFVVLVEQCNEFFHSRPLDSWKHLVVLLKEVVKIKPHLLIEVRYASGWLTTCHGIAFCSVCAIHLPASLWEARRDANALQHVPQPLQSIDVFIKLVPSSTFSGGGAPVTAACGAAAGAGFKTAGCFAGSDFGYCMWGFCLFDGRSLMFVHINIIPRVAFIIVFFWRFFSYVSRAIIQFLLGELLASRIVAAGLLSLLRECLRSSWHATGSSSGLSMASLTVATPSGLSRAMRAWLIWGVNMSMMWRSWNILMTHPIISERFSSDSNAWK